MANRGDKGRRPPAPPGGWPGQPKTPRQVGKVDASKQPRALHIDHAAVEERNLVWRFADLDDSGEWCLSSIERDHLRGLLAKLKSFESMTVGEVFAPGAEHGKRYDIAKLPDRATRRLVEIGRDDETELVRLRCGARPRLYGILREHVFYVLWWDPEHEVYPSPKRHT